MTDDIQAAAERILTLRYTSVDYAISGRLHEDAAELAKFVQGLAPRIEEMERDADETPLTLEWLAPFVRTLPVKRKEGEMPWHWLNSVVFLRCDELGRWAACTMASDFWSWREIAEPKTRGDFYRLCSALGIALQKGTPSHD